MRNVLRSVISGVFLSAAAAINPSYADAPNNVPGQHSIIVHKDDVSGQHSSSIVVAANIVLIMDASGSIDPGENAQMIEGVKATLLSDNMDYSGCFAMTTIRYALQSYVGNTHVFCSKSGVREFVDNELSYYPQIKPSEFYIIGSGTMIGAGIASAMTVFDEEQARGILAERRAVFFIGDGPNSGGGALRNDMETLARTYGATSYAVPIADRDEKDNDTLATRQYYRANLVTPPGFTYIDKEVYGPRPVDVIPGLYREAADFQDVGNAFQYVLQAARF